VCCLQARDGRLSRSALYGGEDGILVLARGARSGALCCPGLTLHCALRGVRCGRARRGAVPGYQAASLCKRLSSAYAELNWQPVVATELEFFIFEPHTDVHQPLSTSRWAAMGGREAGHAGVQRQLQQRCGPVLRGLKPRWAALGIPRDTFMHEMGVHQVEINFVHGDPLA